MPCLSSRHIRRVTLGLCVLGLVISCSVRYTVRLTADDIQQYLRQKLPVRATKLLVTATVTAVQVEFIEQENGIVVRPDVEVSIAGQRLLRGHAVLSGLVRYAPPSGEFFVDQAKVIAVVIEGLPENVSAVVREVVSQCIEGYLAMQPIYRLNQSDFKQSLAKMVLKSVRTHNGRLEIVVGT